uniref:Putative methyltransferase n=1 Tax=viral metagenome TaxID=1070528 RepID=A0A6M3ISU8_9ZZZZ
MGTDCVKRNDKLMATFTKSPMFIERIKVLKKFVNKSPSIDLGCGGFMPSILKTTHACDDTNLAKVCLDKRGWKGKFDKVNIGKKLPYKDKQFKIAVCSEVIEHLKNEKEIANLFNEIERISNEWIVTTPSAFFDDPDHNFFFGPNELLSVIPLDINKFIIIRKGVYYYISNSIEKLIKLLNVKI